MKGPAEAWLQRRLRQWRGKQLRQQHRRSAQAGELRPYMAPVEWSQLLAIASAVAPRIVVEWGAGGGTRALLEALRCVERYVSIEHDESWFRRLREAVPDPRLELCHVAPNEPEPPRRLRRPAERRRYYEWVRRCEHEPEVMRDYIERPRALVQQADLVLVDGRARAFCIQAGLDLLRPGGVLVTHDAQRPEYRAPLERSGSAVFLEPWQLGQIALIHKPPAPGGASPKPRQRPKAPERRVIGK